MVGYCSVCGEYGTEEDYSNRQLRMGSSRKCKDCTGSREDPYQPTMVGYCSVCGQDGTEEDYSNRQLRMGSARKCKDCTGSREDPYVTWECTECYRCFPNENQLRMHMQTHPIFECDKCYRRFNNANELKQHRQVHVPKTTRCPLCGDQRFANMTNAVAHVESGYCSGCKGADFARQNIYDYVRSHAQGRHFLTDKRLLEYGGTGHVSEMPYQCNMCDRGFKALSSLMRHQTDRHGASPFGGENPLRIDNSYYY
jgi:hypothetical protein